MKIKPIYQLIFMILLMLLVIGIILKDDYSIILIQLSKISLILFLYSMNRFPQLYIKISSLLILFLKKLHFIQDPETLFIKGKDMIDQFNIHTSQLKQNKKETFLIIITHGCRLLLLYAIPYLIALLLQLPLTLEDLFRVISISCFVHMLNALTPLLGDAGWSEGMFIFFVYEHVHQKCCRKHDDLMAFCYFLFEYYFNIVCSFVYNSYDCSY